ncbi:AEC family transporter [Nocardia sp. NPDC058058]|uniref:AEC family transporter n=1 Tax=Nocardia sp. NPDC058058 TaxID=3346317 RepID=UPI0036DBC0C2
MLTTVVIAIMESASRDSTVHSGSAVLHGIRAALTTPLVLACWVGIAANAANVPAPRWLLDCLSMAGAAAAPVALFALGLHLGAAGLQLRGADRDEYWLIAMKCVAFPVLAYTVAHFGFHLAQPWLGYVVLIAAMPSPQNLFIFAQTYDTDVDLAASVVVKSTLVTLLLLPLWAVAVVRS